MTQRRDVTLPTLLLASMTVYGFLLVWAQSDTIELTTISGNQGSPMSPAGFNIVTGRNVSIDLPHWRSTSMVPMVTTAVHDTAPNVDTAPTAAAAPSSATIPLPTAPTTQPRGAREPTTGRDAKEAPGRNGGTTGSANITPRAIKKSRAAINSTGRVSIKVKLRSRTPKDQAIKVFLEKACDFFQKLQLEDVTVTLGPERTPMLCIKKK